VRRIWSKSESVGRASMTRLDALVTWLEAQIDEFDLSNIHTVLTRVVDDTASVCAHIQQEIQGPIAVEEPPAERASASALEADEATAKGPAQVQVQS
jgi:hypothetical protein